MNSSSSSISSSESGTRLFVPKDEQKLVARPPPARKSTMRPRARLYYEQLEEKVKGKGCGMVFMQRKLSDEIVERSEPEDDVSKKADDMDSDNKDENDETDKGATHVSTSCCR
jgi:hypothetical protein